MAEPQSGIFVEGTSAHWFQEYDVVVTADRGAVTASVAAVIDAAEPAGLQVVVGFGADMADRMGLVVPGAFRSFETIGAGSRVALATQHELFVWLHGEGRDDLFDAALASRRALTEVGAIVGDVPGFVYHDSRDLTGFIDGTENPSADEGRQIAVVADDRAGGGGSIVLVQRWVHDLDGFHALSQVEQEKVIGRTKPDSVELTGDELPETAHISRVVMEDAAGEEIEIYRRSVPWGDSTEAGLMFIGFTDELAKIDDMLNSMFGTVDGIADHLTDFSRPRTSSYYFTPSQEALTALVGS